MTRVITAQEVLQRFVRSARAQREVAWWTGDERRAEVVPVVMGHQSRHVLAASLRDIAAVCETTEHALGDIRKADIAGVSYVRDWTCPFAGTHVFHLIAESDGKIPTWQRFRQQCATAQFRTMLYEPAQQAIDDCTKLTQVSRAAARDAMQWRIGNMYYSFLREQWAHAFLRHHQVAILQHPLADALFGVDGWIGDRIVSFFIGNSTFRSSAGGRKRSAADLLKDSRPQFTYVDIELPAADKYGVVMLPSARKLSQYIPELRRPG